MTNLNNQIINNTSRKRDFSMSRRRAQRESKVGPPIPTYHAEPRILNTEVAPNRPLVLMVFLAMIVAVVNYSAGNPFEMYFLHSRGTRNSDVIFINNASIYTMKSGVLSDVATGMLVVDGWVEEVFYNQTMDLASIRYKYGALPQSIDAAGKAILPGFIDAHAHMLYLGKKLAQVDVRGSTTVRAIREKLLLYAKGRGQTKWIFGHDDLEDESKILNEFAIVLTRVDYHAVWLNRRALGLLMPHIPKNYSVPGGEIILDPFNKLPTGVLLDNAMDLVDYIKPEITEAESRRFLDLANKEMLKNGITTIQDAGVSPQVLNLLKRCLDSSTPFDVRNYAMILCEKDMTSMCDGEVHPDLLWFKNGNKPYKGKLFVRSVKLMLDGALGSWGAALIDAYTDRPEKGFFRIPPEKLSKTITQWMKKKYQVNIHAIGDLANRVALDSFEEAFKTLNLTKDQIQTSFLPRIEHAQIIHPDDINRFQQLGIIPSMQPTHATSDMGYAEKRLGTARIKAGAYAWRKLINSGVISLPLSSDFPVEEVNPLFGIFAAISRTDKFGNSPHGSSGWYSDEKLSLDEAIRGFTLSAAQAAFLDDQVGSIEPQKRADFIVLNQDFVKMIQTGQSVLKILESAVIQTWIQGKLVYSI